MSTETRAAQVDFSPYPGRRFSVEEYHRMGSAGVLCEDDRVELLEGWIVPKMIHNPLHDSTVALLQNALMAVVPASWHLRIQSAISTADSEPEPDLAVVRGTARDYSQEHPGPRDVGLVVEVARTSLDRDRGKRRLYARAAIPTYWIVNLTDQLIEVYTDPSADTEARYGTRQDYSIDDTLQLKLDGDSIAMIPVRDLLP